MSRSHHERTCLCCLWCREWAIVYTLLLSFGTCWLQSFWDVVTNSLFLWVCSQFPFPFGEQALLSAQIPIQHLVVINKPKAGATRGIFSKCLRSLDFEVQGILEKWGRWNSSHLPNESQASFFEMLRSCDFVCMDLLKENGGDVINDDSQSHRYTCSHQKRCPLCKARKWSGTIVFNTVACLGSGWFSPHRCLKSLGAQPSNLLFIWHLNSCAIAMWLSNVP